MALDPISVVLAAVDQISQPLKAIAQQSAVTQRAIDGVVGIANQLQNAFKSSSANQAFAGVNKDVLALAKSLGKTYEQTEVLIVGLKLTVEQTRKAVSALREMESVKLSQKDQFQDLNKSLGVTKEQFGLLKKAAQETHEKGEEGAEKHGLSVFKLATALEITKGIFSLIKTAGEKAYSGLIQQNVELRSQIQSTAAQLVASQDVLVGGKVVKDTLQAIAAAQEPIKAQISQLRKDSLDISGTTSKDLVAIFQTLSQATGTFKINLEQAEKLTVRLAAQGTALGLSAEQVSGQVSSIARGEIDSYNTVAKSLKLTNERVKELAAEGKLYDYIVKRTEAGVQGQKIAAASFAGVTSNIQEIIENVTQKAGAPLLDVLLQQLTNVYNFFKANQAQIEAFAVTAGEKIGDLITGVAEAGQAIFEAIGPAFNDNKEAIGETLDLILLGFKGIAGLVQSLAPGIAQILSVLGEGYAKLIGLIDQARQKYAEFLGLLSRVPGLNKALGLAGIQIVDPIKEANEALTIYADRADKIARDAVALEGKIANAKKLGKDLTEDQLKANAKLGEKARLQITDLDEQIKLLKQFTPITDADKEKQQAKLNLLKDQKKILEGSLKDLKGGTGEVTLQNKKLEAIGNDYEQLAAKAKAFKSNINSTDDPEKAGAAAKTYQDLLKQQVTLGQVSRAQAIEDLQAIADNKGLKLEARQAAEKEIIALRQKGMEQEKADLETQLATVEGAVRVGRLNEVQGAEEVTRLKKKELDKQLEFVIAEIAREEVLRNAQINEQLKGIETKIAAAQKAKQEALAKGDKDETKVADVSLTDLEKQKANAQASLKIDGERVKDLKNQRQKLSVQQQVAEEEGAEKLQAAKLAVLNRAQKKAEDAIKLSQVEQETQIQLLLNSRSIRQAQADELRIKQKKIVDSKELALEKQKLAALEKLPKLKDEAKEGERQEQIRASRLKTAQLTQQLAKDEFDSQQAAFKSFVEALDEQTRLKENAINAAIEPLNAELKLNEALKNSLDNQNKLLEARKSLQSALSGYVEGELGILAQTAKTQQEKDKITLLTAAVKLRSLQQSQSIEQQVLALNLQQNRAALEQEKIQNRIAILKSKASELKAEAEAQKVEADPTSTEGQKQAARAGVKAAKAETIGLQLTGAFLEQKGEVQEKQGQFQQQAQDSQFALQRDQARAAVVAALPPGERKREAERSLQQDTLSRLGFDGNNPDALRSLNLDNLQDGFRGRGTPRFNLPGGLGNTAAPNIALTNDPRVAALEAQLQDLTKGDGSTPPTAKVQQRTEQVQQQIQQRLNQNAGAQATTGKAPSTVQANPLTDSENTPAISGQNFLKQILAAVFDIDSTVRTGLTKIALDQSLQGKGGNTVNITIPAAGDAKGTAQDVKQAVLNGLYDLAQYGKQQKGKPAT